MKLSPLVLPITALLFLFSCKTVPQKPTSVDDAIEFSVQKLLNTIDDIPDGKYPIRSKNMGEWDNTEPQVWTSGFYPGSLWLAYELSGNETLRDAARTTTNGLQDQQYNTHTHDVGFMMFNSYGNALRFSGSPEDSAVVIQSAKSLATRYHPSVGAIQSWDGDYQVIIDNMMNLELLYWAAKNGGSEELAEIASNHAYKTIAEHFREDGGAFHVVHYDTLTGNVTRKRTEQGFADWSSWARGQAWGIYGFTMAYRETGNKDFLNAAITLGDYFIAHLPEDYIPYWDLNLPGDEPRKFKDSSAGAIALSAFLELRNYVDDASAYDALIEHMMGSLIENYLSYGTEAAGILVHGAYNANRDNPWDWDSSTSWGDYYFLEALIRYKALKEAGA